MAAAKRLGPEQIVAKLRDAERLLGQGATILQVCKKLGVSEQTFYRWRQKYGALKEDEAIRLETLEQENARLKRIGPGHLDAQGPVEGKRLSPARRRDAVAMLIKKHKVSERRAYRVVGQNRSTNRYVATPSDFEEKLVARMVKLAGQHPSGATG